ncbi:hypothetical protein ACP70R_023903 [Stipagrostis hirtigluma subsp. patula]
MASYSPSKSPSSCTSSPSPCSSPSRHAFVFLIGLLSIGPVHLVEVAVGYGVNSGGSISSHNGYMRLDAAAHGSKPQSDGSGLDVVKSQVLEAAAESIDDEFGTSAFVDILVVSSVDVVFAPGLVLLDLAATAEPACGATLPVEMKVEAAITVHQAIELCVPRKSLLLDALVKLNAGATSVSAPLEKVNRSPFLSSGGFFIWWVANMALRLFWERNGLASMLLSALGWQSVLMLGDDDTSSLLQFQSKPTASRLNRLPGIKHKEASVAVLNCIHNHRDGDGRVDSVVRVDHHRSPRPVSLSPRFDNSSHVHPCLSPVKRIKNPRLNASQPQVPSPIKQPERPPAGLSVGTEEDFGCHRRGCLKDLFAIVTAGLRRVHPLFLCVILEFRLCLVLPCLVYGIESQRLLLCSSFSSHLHDSSFVARKLHLCQLGMNSSNLVLWLL